MAITVMPRSLLARSVLLIALILSASQVAWVQFYRMSSARSQSEQVASHVVGVLSTVSAALDAMPAASPRRASMSTSWPSSSHRCSQRCPNS